MSQTSSPSSFSSASGSQKTSYNKHFRRSFPLNYGGALQDLDEEAVLSRLHDFSCEWLQRLNIALSEMAQMLWENFPLLVGQTPGMLDPDFVENILVHFRPLSGALSRLDNKDKTTSEPATREDVVAVLRTITGELDLEERIREGLNAAGALFMVCVHLLVPQTLMRNPEDFAEKARRTLANQSFKEDPTPRRMRNFVLDSITKKRRPVPGASIWDAGEEDDKDSCRGEAEPVAAQTLGEVFPEAGTISLTAQPAPKGTSRPKQSCTADWTAEPEGQDQPQ